ncbi:MAG: NADPH-dependent oxidoreductase [Myxococcales bacterium]|nr:NADPH-dependent oxidoreductase [Myxococcales bacterium]
MNDTIALLHRHRSVRHYTDAPVLPEHIEAAVLAGQAASTSSAVQAYSVLQVNDPAVREAIVPLTGGQTKVANSGAFFIICGDVRRHRLACEMANKAYEARLEAFLIAATDASFFAQNMVVAFESLGYGICYIGGLRNQLREVDKLLNLPEGTYPLYGLCVGVPAEAPIARPRLPIASVLFQDSFPDDDTLKKQMSAYNEDYAKYMVARGAPARGWTDAIVKGASAPRRAYLADYYATKGADLS